MNVSHVFIADTIRSRELSDRRRAQYVIHETLDQATEDPALTQRPYATVGDELQAASATLTDILALAMRTHLPLPDGLGLYLGIGVGVTSEIEGAVGGGVDGTPGRLIQDGPVWWAARKAIEKAHHLQDAERSLIRTWLRIHPDVVGRSEGKRSERERVVNSVLILRNQMIFHFQPRRRYIMAGPLIGVTQIEIARQGKMSQQAVSEFARSASSSLLEAQGLPDGLSGGGEEE